MGNAEVPNWLEGLPLAPEFRPTDTEFSDPIAYISKIEKEASLFGICKIIPPLPKPSKKFVFDNLNKSLLKCPELGGGYNGGDGEARAVFTTRQQELGQSGRKVKGVVNGPQLVVKKQVWQSGENYTLEQFESKSKAFARATVKETSSPLVIETLFWKAASEKPIYIEYANDVPGSAFGEPEGQFRHLHRRRRRKRMSCDYHRSTPEDSDTKKKDETESVRNNHDNKSTGSSVNNEEVTCAEIPSSSSLSSGGGASQLLRRKSVNASNDMEGTAGWKISNSPWNLQVIARSPGSLTRFMPDDIPGVTSPMVYIGMLFSWFAWHVEDHELHSMNFLHTGSPKTWYSVPGDYAFAFEELIRTDVYGGSIDRLAALTMLGEKTTLISPEIIAASGIPCCRLVQNPGEFVVTFPRAYHVGFSHGFNCGEAANFGTPQWLKVAKKAAIRRAAMNYLPMLSHQQLLYLLTMSFVLRVPRSLLPGARSSRLRDRQREEREYSVKKAFIEDMLNENKKLSVLLGRESSYHTVLWHPDLLPYPSKESQSPSIAATAIKTTNEDTALCNHENSKNQNNLYEEMSLYMGTLNDLYVDEDDLSSDFQMDSGTLACVACGILGFPFMSVIQQSEKASKEFVVSGQPSSALHGNVDDFVSGSPQLVTDTLLPPNIPSTSKVELDKVWCTSTKSHRPHIFCLEHALQIEELLRPKGGAKVLVICHSDYKKMKAHTMAVAEDIGCPFDYHDVPLLNASPQDLDLIYLAIDDGELEFGEDWTSKLGINLRHCVKFRKNSPSMRIQHALVLDGLFSDDDSHSKILNVKWQFRRSRSKIMSNTPTISCKPHKKVDIKKGEVLAKKLNLKIDQMVVKKEKKLLQYSRKNRNSINSLQQKAPSQDLDEQRTKSSATKVSNNPGDTEPHSSSISIGMTEKMDEASTESMSLNSPCSQVELATHNGVSVKDKVPLKFNRTSRGNGEEPNKLLEITEESCATKELQEAQAHENKISRNSVEECSEVPRVAGTETLNTKMQETRDKHESIVTRSQPMTLSEPEALEGTSTRETSTHDIAGDGVMQDEDHAENMIGADEPAPFDDTSSQDNNNELQCMESNNTLDFRSKTAKKRKRKTELDQIREDNLDDCNGFIKSPCEGLRSRSRSGKDAKSTGDVDVTAEERSVTKVKASRDDKKPPSASCNGKKQKIKESHKCDLEGCQMVFPTKEKLRLHKNNRCTYEGCGKKFSTHKYAVLHQRVHDNDRPLKCPWKGCTMSFKWAWARTEHIRVHTGERPYKCKVDGCGLSFRFVSDYSRHRRKTNHYVNSTPTG